MGTRDTHRGPGVGPNQYIELFDNKPNFDPILRLRMPILGLKLAF